MTDHMAEMFKHAELALEQMRGEFLRTPQPVSRFRAIAALLLGDPVTVEKDGIRHTGYRWRGKLYVVSVR